MRVFTIGHGQRPAQELVECLREAHVRTVIDVRRYPVSRRNPQFRGPVIAQTLREAGFAYLHVPELGGLRRDEPGEDRFACIGTAAFRSYAALMTTREWQEALDAALHDAVPCLMCAETQWERCHRRLISEYLTAHAHDVWHLIRPGEREPHRPSRGAEARDGRLYLCGELVA
jgi:uncharacterized protein (DUF488 family)